MLEHRDGRGGRFAFSVKDLQHEVYKSRRLKMEGGDSIAMMNYFQQMQVGNQNFYHAQRLDEQGRLKDVLWVDARSRAAYEEFGDVVCFDATYLNNDYDLPFVNFVGVNFHGQSILLGCALVSHEDSDTFRWIFKQWLECMNDKAPKAILTDQAAAMRKPLEEIMPSTRHRWCIWHIMRKIPEKLSKCEGYQQLKAVLKGVMYDSQTILEFENRWNAFIANFKLEENDWLEGLYNERHMWVPAFMKDYFLAGMKTTQRVESINNFFDGFVTRNTKLFEFPQKYVKVMDKRIRDETEADAKCSRYIRRLVSGFKVEKLFQKLYTDTKFQEVQKECTRMMYCYPREENTIADNLVQYLIEDRVWIVPEGKSEEVLTDRRRFVSATFNTQTKVVCCDCRKFQTHGIMCKHSIRILDINLVVDISQYYIVRRWRKDILRKHTRVKDSYHDPNKTSEGKRFNMMMHAFEPVCDEAAMVNDETVDMVITCLEKLKAEVSLCSKRKLEQTIPVTYPDDSSPTVHQSSGAIGTNSTVQNPFGESPVTASGAEREGTNGLVCNVKDPVTKKRGRGRPKGSRIKSLAEIGYKKPTKKNATVNGKNCMATGTQVLEDLQQPRKIVIRRKVATQNKLVLGLTDLDFVVEDDVLVVGSQSGISDIMLD